MLRAVRFLIPINLVEAKPVHVSKYSAGYRALFPTADQLIVASTTGNLAYPATLLVIQYKVSSNILTNDITF